MFTVNTLFNIILALASLPAMIYYSIQIWEYLRSQNNISTEDNDTQESDPSS